MSTKIGAVKGTYLTHNDNSFSKHQPAELFITRFSNGKRGTEIDITIHQKRSDGYISYIHLSEDGCRYLAEILKDAFDETKYPSK